MQHGLIIHGYTDLEGSLKGFEGDYQRAMAMEAAHPILAQAVGVSVASVGPDGHWSVGEIWVIEHQAINRDAESRLLAGAMS